MKFNFFFKQRNNDTSLITKIIKILILSSDNLNMKCWHKLKTKPIKADITILGNKTLLRFFRKFNSTTINDNTDFLEVYTPETKVPCLLSSLTLIAFLTSHSLHTKTKEKTKSNFTQGSEKTKSNFTQIFYFSFGGNIMQKLHNISIKQTSTSKPISGKTRL